MGFNRALGLEVFFACNKNEELAANYLLDHVHEFEDWLLKYTWIQVHSILATVVSYVNIGFRLNYPQPHAQCIWLTYMMCPETLIVYEDCFLDRWRLWIIFILFVKSIGCLFDVDTFILVSLGGSVQFSAPQIFGNVSREGVLLWYFHWESGACKARQFKVKLCRFSWSIFFSFLTGHENPLN